MNVASILVFIQAWVTSAKRRDGEQLGESATGPEDNMYKTAMVSMARRLVLAGAVQARLARPDFSWLGLTLADSGCQAAETKDCLKASISNL